MVSLTLGVLALVSTCVNGIKLTVSSDGGNASSPLLYGMIFEVGSYQDIRNAVAKLNRISTILEMVFCMVNCFGTMAFKVITQVSQLGPRWV